MDTKADFNNSAQAFVLRTAHAAAAHWAISVLRCEVDNLFEHQAVTASKRLSLGVHSPLGSAWGFAVEVLIEGINIDSLNSFLPGYQNS